MKITKSEFGTTKNGSIINLFHLENTSGAYVEIIDFSLPSDKIVVPDRNGDPVDVCLGFSTADHYADDDASLHLCCSRRSCQPHQRWPLFSEWKRIPACHQQRNKSHARRYRRLRF